MKRQVLVLGGSGMLGSMIVDLLARADGLSVTATVREEGLAARYGERVPEAEWRTFEVCGDGREELEALVGGHAWIINAIGITKPLIQEDDSASVHQAVQVNSAFPFELARAADAADARVLQIATDCVYSGTTGGYDEDAAHDARDVYGKTKSLGEVPGPGFHNLRCSIVGPEPKAFKFLLHWFLGQPEEGEIGGYVNHRWNGVTTLAFARVCEGVVRGNVDPPNLQHLVPADTVTKCRLLELFARHYGREDVTIRETEAPSVVDRTLDTRDPGANHALWEAAGYDGRPSIALLVEEMAGFDYRFPGA